MEDEKRLSRRRILATTLAAGCWGGLPGHAWPEPQPSEQDPGQGPGRAPAQSLAPADRKGPPQFDQSGRDQTAAAAWNPSEGPNRPMGEGRGIYPGRVVWVHNPEVATWDGITERNKVTTSTGQWWDDAHCNQDICTEMMSSAVLRILPAKNRKKRPGNRSSRTTTTPTNSATTATRPVRRSPSRSTSTTTGRTPKTGLLGGDIPARSSSRPSFANWSRTRAFRGEDITVFDGASGAGSSATPSTTASWPTPTKGCTRSTSR